MDFVFPTHVGVFPLSRCLKVEQLGLPHARGGVSVQHGLQLPVLLSSPRTWGCFYPESFKGKVDEVFPTHVGVFLSDQVL